MDVDIQVLDQEAFSGAELVDSIVREVLGAVTPVRRLMIAYLAYQATWVGGTVAIRLAELTASSDPARSRLATDALTRLADALALPLTRKMRDRNRYCRKECTEALKACVPFLRPSRRQEVAMALLAMILCRTDPTTRTW